MSETTVPVYVSKPTHGGMKEEARKAGKKLYRLTDEVLAKWLSRRRKNGARK